MVYGKERESDLSFPSVPRKALSTRHQESLCTFDSSAKRGSVFVSGRIKAFSSTVGPTNAVFSTPCRKSLCILQRNRPVARGGGGSRGSADPPPLPCGVRDRSVFTHARSQAAMTKQPRHNPRPFSLPPPETAWVYRVGGTSD